MKCRRSKLRRRYGCFRLPVVKGAKTVKATARKDANWLARTDPKAKEIEFSIHNFSKLSPEGKRFIVLHERAHLKTGTDHNSAFYDELVKLCDANGIDWRTAFQLESFNCFSGDTKFWTDSGLVSFKEKVGQTVRVLAGDGAWRPAKVKRFCADQLFEYTFSPHKRSSFELKYLATADHRWFTASRGEVTDLKVGDVVWVFPRTPKLNTRYMNGWIHGLVFGDGAREQGIRGPKNKFQLRLCGAKNKAFLPLLLACSQYTSHSYPPSFGGDPVVHLKSTIAFKEVPTGTDFDYQSGFLKGWLDADGTITKSNSYVLDTVKHEALSWIVERAPMLGVTVVGRFLINNLVTNLGRRSRKMMRLSLRYAPADFVVRRVNHTFVTAPTYCVVEPKTGMFTLSGGIPTGNCHAKH